jgi:hypothetical protein
MVALVAALLAASLLMTGCSSTPPTPDKQAEQLAADLGGESKVTVDGDTVRLTGEVYLKTGLTVPAGVTLDLTADGAKFELQNGAELTVDGTVNTSGHGDRGKGWVEGGLRIGDGTAVISGSGTINLKSKGCLLNIGNRRHLTLDGVTLVGIEDNDRSLVQVGEGGEFVLKGGAITGNTAKDNGGVEVWKGTFIMEGGEISDNTVTGNSGGVFIDGHATFTKTGGTIYGDTDTTNTPNSTENTALSGN